MKLLNICISLKDTFYKFNGVYDLRIMKTISFSKTMKLKGGIEYKIRYSFDWEALGDSAMISICEAKKKDRKKNG